MRTSISSSPGQNLVLNSSGGGWDRLDQTGEDGALQPLLGSDRQLGPISPLLGSQRQPSPGLETNSPLPGAERRPPPGLGTNSPLPSAERRPPPGLGTNSPLPGAERRPTPGLGSISQPASFHSNVPGLQPMSTSRCSMQSSGWL